MESIVTGSFAVSAATHLDRQHSNSRDLSLGSQVTHRLDSLESAMNALTNKLNGICSDCNDTNWIDLAKRVDRMELLLFRTAVEDFASIDLQLAQFREDACPEPILLDADACMESRSLDHPATGMKSLDKAAASFVFDGDFNSASAIEGALKATNKLHTVDDIARAKSQAKARVDKLRAKALVEDEGVLNSSSDIIYALEKKLSAVECSTISSTEKTSTAADWSTMSPSLAVVGADLASDDYSTTSSTSARQAAETPTYLGRLPEHARSWAPDCQVIQLIETDKQIRKLWIQHIASDRSKRNPCQHSERSIAEFLSKLSTLDTPHCKK